jgi:hypothetical protein
MSEHSTEAVHFIKRLRGSSEAVLTRCSDGCYYALKFTTNPNGLSSLLHEVLISRLARQLSLPVPDYSFVQVSQWLIENTPEISRVDGQRKQSPREGVHFGSKTPYGSDCVVKVFEQMPEETTHLFCNEETLAGMLAFDLWTGRSEPRQGLFIKRQQWRQFDVCLIDHRANLTEEVESFTALPLLKSYYSYYTLIEGWESFEPWLTQIEQMSEDTLDQALEYFPGEWSVLPEWKTETKSYLLARSKMVRSGVSRVLLSNPGLFRNLASGRVSSLAVPSFWDGYACSKAGT